MTATPTAMSSRSLNAAIDLRARRTFGFWPVITPSCSAALSSRFVSSFASPTPMFTVILTSRGACITVLYSNRSMRLGRISLS